LIASCGVERWDQKAGRLAAVLNKHPVVVSRWVGEASHLRRNDREFGVDLEALDLALSEKAMDRIEGIRA
jgi:hypothetical protein